MPSRTEPLTPACLHSAVLDSTEALLEKNFWLPGEWPSLRNTFVSFWWNILECYLKNILAFLCAYSLHRVWLFLALWTVAWQFPLSTDSSGKKVPTWCGLPFPSPNSTCRHPNYLWKFVNCFAKKPSITLSWCCVEIHYAVHFWTDWENFLSLL